MSRIKALIKRHALLIYFAVAFALSCGGGLVLIGAAPMRSDPRFMIIVLAASKTGRHGNQGMTNKSVLTNRPILRGTGGAEHEPGRIGQFNFFHRIRIDGREGRLFQGTDWFAD